jgi:hypothetical protein
MPTHNLHTEKSCIFLDRLGIEPSQPQRRHILNTADALLTREGKKTLAALQRQLVEAPHIAYLILAELLPLLPTD